MDTGQIAFQTEGTASAKALTWACARPAEEQQGGPVPGTE